MAHYALATAYMIGRLAKKNEAVAAKHAAEAARMQLPEGEYLLGLFYLKGTGVPRDLAKARAWLEKAAAAGYEDAAAALKVAQ